MDHRDIYHIMNNVSAQLYCPYCKGKVSTKNCRLMNVYDEDCVFDVTCPHCTQHLVMGAHLDRQQSWQDMVSNQSTMIQKKFHQTGIHTRDIGNIKRVLKSYNGDIKQLFAS